MPHNFAVTLTDKQYQTLKSDPNFTHWDADSLFEFDDIGKRVLVHGVYRALRLSSTRRKLRDNLGMYDPEEAIENFATDAYKQKVAQDRDNARDLLRNVAPTGGQSVPPPNIAPDKDALGASGDLLAGGGGMVLGYEHRDQPSKDLARDLIKSGKVSHVFVEEFPIELQDDINTYLESPSGEMSPELEKHLKDIKSHFNVDFEPMLIAARENAVKIHGIDSVEADPGVDSRDPRYHERRVAMMNAVAKRVFDQVRQEYPNDSFMAMTGGMHVNTVEGGIPGLAQIMGVPGVSYDGGKLIYKPEDTSKRGMSSALEQEFVDDCLVKAKDDYAKALTEFKKTTAYTSADPQPRVDDKLTAVEVTVVAQRLASHFTQATRLNGSGDIPGLLTDVAYTNAFNAVFHATFLRNHRKEELKKAAKSGDLNKLKQALDADPYLLHMECDYDQRANLLHVAAMNGHGNLVDELLTRGLSPNSKTAQGQTPLHLILSKDIPSEKMDAMSSTISKLLARGADHNLQNPEGKSGVELAKSGPSGDGRLVTPFVTVNAANLTDLFVARFVDKTFQTYKQAREQGEAQLDDAEVRRAAAQLATQLAQGSLASAETVAAALRTDPIASEIMRLVNLTKARNGRLAQLSTAIEDNDTDALGELLTADPLLKNTEIDGKMPLALAAVKGSFDVVTSLINDHGVDVNQVNSKGRSALLEVASQEVSKTNKDKQQEITSICVELIGIHKADINSTNGGGQTALHQAGFRNNSELVGVLADLGADASIKDYRGWTALDMTIASTNKEAEAMFYETNLSDRDPPLVDELDETGDVLSSTVDILCQATLCNDPSQEAEVRKRYETLYADESMRPMLDLAAAAACNPRDPPKGGLRIFFNNSKTVGQLYGQSIGPSGAYDEKVNTLLVPMQKHNEKDPIGTLAHELTHLAAHLVTNDEATMPFESEKEKQDYLTAIEEDVKKLHLLNPQSPQEQFILDRFSGRMGTYADRGGDKQLLQEYLVGVPQLAAVYGMDYVEKHVPNLAKFYKKFSARCTEVLKEDERFSEGRRRISSGANEAMVDRLDRSDAKPPSKDMREKLKYEQYIKPDSGFLSGKGNSDEEKIQGLLDKVRTDFITKHGSQKDLGGRSVVYKASDYELTQEQQQALDAKLEKVKQALVAQIAKGSLPPKVNGDSVRELIESLSDTCHSTSLKELGDALENQTLNWVKNEKIGYVDHLIAEGRSMEQSELAEAIVYRAQAEAHGDGERLLPTTTVNQKKQNELIQQLTNTFRKPEHSSKLKDPSKLVNTMSKTLALDSNKSIYLKPNATEHISIDKKRAKRTWLAQLKTMPDPT